MGTRGGVGKWFHKTILVCILIHLGILDSKQCTRMLQIVLGGAVNIQFSLSNIN